MPEIDKAEIARRFSPHALDKQSTVDAVIHVRDEYTRLGETMARVLPESREKSLAITALEESSFWAVAALARNQ